MNDFLGGIFALMFIGGLLAYLGPLLVDVLQWFLALIGAYWRSQGPAFGPTQGKESSATTQRPLTFPQVAPLTYLGSTCRVGIVLAIGKSPRAVLRYQGMRADLTGPRL